eukprot:CAMPEP_0113306638 /NCGR_PEP_ID=MMETSP0010_2-20120614/5811_1 /TAXON_ID=216773 ORGANISM="Corethron hystrix, Strain 308" /NCGR_SAMPLE_ID=MMETSP0010_2 /ASSEMBLY_ACC=CAM_ASM_000155 /LENGTH=124 /DNA_ID=CAMNT_0000161349 /DNA_START=104 /DNA_END=474 /DNA_ORIENTATION=+ /assembly_acc=CAM_ASM_000155
MAKSTCLIFAALATGSVSAFYTSVAPLVSPRLSTTAVSATDDSRREAFGVIAGILGGVVAAPGAAFAQQFSSENFIIISKLQNPAAESWKGKFKGQQYTPGKGLRAHDELVAKLQNPAAESWKG